MNTPTRGELRELRGQIDAELATRDRAWKAHDLVAVEHACSRCFAAGFAAGLNYKRKNP